MHDTLIKMKDGREFCGPIWLWRPQYGYLTLAGEGADVNFNHPIQFAGMESAVTKNERIAPFTTGDQDELARALSEMKYPHDEEILGNIGLKIAEGTFLVKYFEGGEAALWAHMKVVETPGEDDPLLLVRTRPVHMPFERGELAGFKGRLQLGFDILMYSESDSSLAWFWIKDTLRVDPKAKGSRR
jgi:hypothetical protein